MAKTTSKGQRTLKVFLFVWYLVRLNNYRNKTKAKEAMMLSTKSYVVQTQGHLDLKAIGRNGIDISVSTIDGVTVFEINEPDTTVEVVVRRKNSDAVDCSADADESESVTVFTSEQVEMKNEESDTEEGDNDDVVVNDTEEIKVSYRESLWTKHFNELVRHKQQTGSCANISDKTQKKLARWVNYVRTSYKNGKLSEQRRVSLEELGLNLQFEDRQARQAFWDARYSELVDYKQEHGDCEVPQKYKRKPKLASWVTGQRTAYRDGTMSEERYAKLNDLGFRFTWSVRESNWNDRYKELLEFKKKHGHCMVPREYEDTPGLGQWVATQRYQHTTRKLKDERFEKLHAIDFQWDAPNLDKTETSTLSPESGDNTGSSSQRLDELDEAKDKDVIPAKAKPKLGI